MEDFFKTRGSQTHRQDKDRLLGHHLHHGFSDSRTGEASTDSLTVRVIVASLLGIILLSTVGGLFVLWPDSAKIAQLQQSSTLYSFAPGVSVENARITKISTPCQPLIADEPRSEQSPKCVQLHVTLLTGADRGSQEVVEAHGPGTNSNLRRGDVIQVMYLPDADIETGQYSFYGIPRGFPLWIFAAIFVLTVLVVARWKGLLSLLGLGFSVLIVLGFVLPALASGQPGIWVGLVGSTLILFVVVHLAHGFSMRTEAAMLGTIIGLILSTLFGIAAVEFGKLSGYIDETAFDLSAYISTLDLRQLWIAATILAGIGVLNDVTITQTSTVWELRIAAPDYSSKDIYLSAMRVGRDHIASTIYTIVFAYTGAALTSFVMIAMFFNEKMADITSSESISAEVLRILASGTTLILSIPLTTAIAVALVKKTPRIAQGAQGTQRALSENPVETP